jgi:hypothetical protein
MLALQLPLNILAKHKNNLFQLEALLFGVANIIDGNDQYAENLRKEFLFLQKKYSLQKINKSAWKFARMRPASFPTLRLAQLASLIYNSSHLYSKIIAMEKITDLYQLFQYPVSEYWQEHYSFGKKTTKKMQKTGNAFIDTLILNVVVPYLFFEGKFKDDDKLIQRAHEFAEQLKPEINSKTKSFSAAGLTAVNAAESQAMIQLKTFYCDRKKCLSCAIGYHLLKSGE